MLDGSMERFGLDFGTSNSSLARARGEDAPELCALDPAAPVPAVLRSLLYYSPDTRGFVTGRRAIDEYLAEDMRGTLMQSLKTFLADDSFDETWVQDRAYTLEDLLSVIFRQVGVTMRSVGAGEDTTLVVGRPAVFVARPEKEGLARKRLAEAARRAGFLDVRFQYEPIAAGLAYEASLARPETALIADLGGGTSDFTVMRLGTRARGDRRTDILATGGVQVGGDTFDARIMAKKVTPHFGAGTSYRSMEGRDLPFPSHVLAQLGRWHQVAFLRTRKTRDLLRRLRTSASDPGAVERLATLVEGNYAFFVFEAIERAKAALSSAMETTIRFHEAGIEIDEPLTRAELEALIEADVAEVRRCMDGVIASAGVAPAAVESVFLTGGSAQIPALRRIFEATFGADRLRAQDYLTTVACGLALSDV
jgi:hypothetical chaperone protein